MIAHSASVVADGVESAGDVVASGFAFLGFQIAGKSADKNHPYGHGRYETLTGLVVGIILFLGGIGVCFRSLESISLKRPTPGAYAIWPLLLSMLAKAALSTMRVAKESPERLTDTMPTEDHMRSIRAIALSVAGVNAVERCFARSSGLQYHVDLHIEVDPEMTVRTSREIANEVRFTIRRRLDWVADVLVHFEPTPDAPMSGAQIDESPFPTPR